MVSNVVVQFCPALPATTPLPPSAPTPTPSGGGSAAPSPAPHTGGGPRVGGRKRPRAGTIRTELLPAVRAWLAAAGPGHSGHFTKADAAAAMAAAGGQAAEAGTLKRLQRSMAEPLKQLVAEGALVEVAGLRGRAKQYALGAA